MENNKNIKILTFEEGKEALIGLGERLSDTIKQLKSLDEQVKDLKKSHDQFKKDYAQTFKKDQEK